MKECPPALLGKPVIGLKDLKGRNLPNFGPYAKERADIVANIKQAGALLPASQWKFANCLKGMSHKIFKYVKIWKILSEANNSCLKLNLDILV